MFKSILEKSEQAQLGLTALVPEDKNQCGQSYILVA
jgi:hypothetical protein